MHITAKEVVALSLSLSIKEVVTVDVITHKSSEFLIQTANVRKIESAVWNIKVIDEYRPGYS